MAELGSAEELPQNDQEEKRVKELRQEMVDALLSSPERTKKIAQALLTSKGENFDIEEDGLGDDPYGRGRTIRVSLNPLETTIFGALEDRTVLGIYLKDGSYQGGINTVLKGKEYNLPGATWVPEPFTPSRGRSGAFKEPEKVKEFLTRLKNPTFRPAPQPSSK